MSHSPKSNSASQPKPNQKVATSIVHQPFETGTINIFNPFRSKSKSSGEPVASKLVVNAVLEDSLTSQAFTAQLEPNTTETKWLNKLLTPWSLSAIALLLLGNIISGITIWQNPEKLITTAEIDAAASQPESLSAVGSSNLAQQEFVTLDLDRLSTLSTPKTVNSTPTVLKPEIAASSPLPLAQLSSRYYYIVTDYTGDHSLKSIRQVVESVSLVNFSPGVFVYLGAFTEENAARDFVAQLEQSGIDAFIYPLE